MPGGLEIEALRSLASHNQSLADWSTLIVVLGLIGEIIVTFAYAKGKPLSEIVFGVICGIVIAIGVFGEYSYGSRAAHANTELRRISDLKIADLNNKAADAERDSAQANSRALEAESHLASADAHAKEADAKAEGFRLQIAQASERAAMAERSAAQARLELEQLKTPRHLSPAQSEKLRADVAAFPKLKLGILMVGNQSDVPLIGGVISQALRNANMEVHTASMSSAGLLVVFGIFIGARPGSEKIYEQAASLLISDLNSFGVGSQKLSWEKVPNTMYLEGDPEATTAPLLIVVGSKPGS